MPEVERVFVCEVHRFAMRELEEVEAVADKGIRGCIHGRPGRIEVLPAMARQSA